MTMEVEEMRTILEDIARDAKNGAARIAAIRQLRELDGDATGDEDGFAALDAGDELAPRRRKKAG